MASDFDDEGFSPIPPAAEPPEGALELALQEEAADSDAITPDPALPTVLGRSVAFDMSTGRFLPEGRQPAMLYGRDALRQRVEKCLRDERGLAAVHDDSYGLEGAYDQPSGEPFDGAEFADLEERYTDALVALPGVLAVEDFDAEGGLTADTAIVSFRVIPEDDTLDPLDFERVPVTTE